MGRVERNDRTHGLHWTIFRSFFRGAASFLFTLCVFAPFSLLRLGFFLHVSVVEALDAEQIRRAVQAPLAEDIAEGDPTTMATVPPNATASARMSAREALVVAGVGFAEAAFREISAGLQI